MFVYQRKVNGRDALIIQNTIEAKPIPGAEIVAVYVNTDGNFTYTTGTVDEDGEIIPGEQPSSLPEVTTEDNGRVLTVIEGEWGVADAQTGTTVVANPTLAGTENDLTGLEVDGTKYAVPQGTEVVANPTLVGDEEDLESIQIGNTKYKISGGSAALDALMQEEF